MPSSLPKEHLSWQSRRKISYKSLKVCSPNWLKFLAWFLFQQPARKQVCSRRSASLVGVSIIHFLLIFTAISLGQEHPKLLTQLGIGQLNAAAISYDNRFVVTGSKAGKLTLWFADSATQMTGVQLASSVNSVAFSPDGRMVAAGCEDGTTSLWDVRTFRQVRTLPFESSDERHVLSVAFSKDGTWIATGSGDKAARIWDRSSGKLVRTFKMPSQLAEVDAVALSSDRRYLLTGSTDTSDNSESSTVRIWDTSNGELTRSFDLKSGDSAVMHSVAFSTDDKLIVAGSTFGVGLLDAGSGQLIHSWRDYSPKSVAISPDGAVVVAGGSTRDDSGRERPGLSMFNSATGELIRNLKGHLDAITSVAFSSDGRFILSGSVDGTARLWDAAKGKEVHRFFGNTSSVESIEVSPSGQSLLIGSAYDSAHLWDLTTGQEMMEFDGRSDLASADSVAFSPDEKEVLTAGGLSGPARLWDASTGSEIRTMQDDLPAGGVKGTVRTAAFSPNGRFVLTGNSVFMNEQMAWLWNRTTGSRLRSYGGPSDEVTSAVFSPDGRSLLTGGRNGGAWLWDAATGSLIRVFHNSGGMVTSVAFSPDGHSILAGSANKTAVLWGVATGKKIRVFKGHAKAVMAVAFSRDGKHIVTGSQDATAKIWDASTGELQLTLVTGAVAVNDVAFAASDQVVMTAGWKTTLWNVATGEPIREFPFPGVSMSRGVTISQDGRYLLESLSSEVTLYDATSGNKVHSFVGHTGNVGSVAISPDGRSALTGSDDKTTRLWNIATEQQIRSFQGNETAVNVVAFSPDGKTVMSVGKDKSIRLWDADTGNDLQVIESQASVLYVAAFATDDSVLTGGTDGVLKLWNRETGREIRAFEGLNQSVFAMAVSANHGLLLAGSEDHTARLWELATGKPLITFAGHTDSVIAVAMSPNLQYILTGSRDNTARLWDRATGRQLRVFAGHDGAVSSVAFTTNSRFVLTGSDDTTTRIWDVNTGKQLATILNYGDTSWAVVDSEGRFDTNNLNGGSPLGWLISSDPQHPLPLEIFMRDYYRPQLLSKVLRHQQLPDMPSLTSLNRVQPSLKILEAKPETTLTVNIEVLVANERSKVQKDATGQFLKSGVYDVRLFRDGQLVGQWPEQPVDEVEKVGPIVTEQERAAWRKTHAANLDASGEATITFHNIRLPQRPGVERTIFTAYAFNSDGVKSLTTPPYEYVLPPHVAPGNPRKAFLITIGVNANESHNLDLELAVSSAERARSLLHSKLQIGYQDVVEIPLYSDFDDNHQVTPNAAKKAHLKAVLDLLAGRRVSPELREEVDPKHQLQAATPDDAVVLYVASHGYADPQGTFYLMLYDTGLNWGVTEDLLTHCQGSSVNRSAACKQARDLLARSVSSADLTSWWNGIDAGEMVMILDSCHSGAVPGKEFRPAPLGDPGFGQLSYDKGMAILSASQPAQTERGEWVSGGEGRTLLVDALETIGNNNSKQSLRQLLHAVEEQLPRTAQQLYPNLKQEDVQSPVLLDFTKKPNATISTDQ